MSNNNNQSVSINNNTTNNKENNMISVQQVKALLENYKQVQPRGAELQATLDNYQALQTQAEKNNKAIAKRMIEILTAIKTLEANNNSLQKAVEDKGNVQAVIDTQKECFDILDEIEEIMTSPEEVEETNSTLVVPAECSTEEIVQVEEKAPLPELKKPKFVRPIVKKAKEVAVAAAVATATITTPVATADMVENPQPQKQTVHTVEAVEGVKNAQPAEGVEQINNAESIEEAVDVVKMFEAPKPQKKFVESVGKIDNSEAEYTVHQVDGKTIHWREEIFFFAKMEMKDEIKDFLEEFVVGFESNDFFTFEMQQQLRESVLSRKKDVEQVPLLVKTLEFVEYQIAQHYLLNHQPKLDIDKHKLIEVRQMLDLRAYLPGCIDHPSNIF